MLPASPARGALAVQMFAAPALAALSLATLTAAGGCQSAARNQSNVSATAPADAEAPPLFQGMGDHTRRITTNSREAQRYFNQALTWTYGFNHDEAIRSYEHAARLDPDCAMAFWGIAYSHGPHINNPFMTEERSRAAWDALTKARALLPKASSVERDLINALAKRYADPAAGDLPLDPESRAPYDRAYADAMRAVHQAYPNDADVATLFAEALMDLRPWDLYDHRTREPRPETPEIVAALEHAMRLNPDHPGANHLYIHAMEASATPERAVPAANRLRTLVPMSGHLVHMPAHIDVRVGRWDLAAESNRRASAADAAYRQISPNQGFYRLYMAHNDHFLAWNCMMLGRREEGLAAARAMVAKIPADYIRDNAEMVDPYAAIEIETLVRFGRWDDILAMSPPPEFLPITTAKWRFARATALAAQQKLDEADREAEAFRAAVARVPDDALMAINPAHKVLRIAEHTLAGEIAFHRGDTDAAVSHLTKAVDIEDDLLYMEPPDWIQPVRHSLGAVLLAGGRHADAERVYRDDLARWPNNGWSLHGLARALDARNAPEAADAHKAFKRAWADADTTIHATCLCIPDTGARE